MAENLETQLKKVQAECNRLREENKKLKALLVLPKKIAQTPADLNKTLKAQQCDETTITNQSSVEIKLALFSRLFQSRGDVYALRWESKNGRSGYSPACKNEWNRLFCNKQKVKCSQCENRELLPLSDQVISNHLTGKQTIGIYPLLPDEKCWFLVVDFDKTSWMEDAGAFLQTCREMKIEAVLERSRSGNGGHIWIFFNDAISASLARQLGSAILTMTMVRHPQIGLDSYDRFFPNQDTMPKGGFGNLIALPLQNIPRAKGNSIFLDADFKPYVDQWAYLSSVRKMKVEEVESLVNKASRTGNMIDIRISSIDSDEDPWTLPSSKRIPDKPITGKLPKKIKIILSNLLFIEKKKLPPAMLNRLIRLAAFQNPEFYKAQAMRLPTYDKPRVISCAEDFHKHIGLPRGCLSEIANLLEDNKIKVELIDERFPGTKIKAGFNGTLKPLQKKALKALLLEDIGILSASTAFGKTVVGTKLIASRKVNTLILVHRRQLLDQWRERLADFLGLPLKSIGQIGGGKNKPTGVVDVALIQSLYRKGEVKDIVADYGQVIVDECHHLSAFSFEQVLKEVKAKYIVGLTATPVRKDGHHPIIMMQCGPIRFRTIAKEQAKIRPFDHAIIPRYTKFNLPVEIKHPSIQEVYANLIVDEARNSLIIDDILRALKAGRSPLLLTERTDHVDYFYSKLNGLVKNVIVLKGGMGAKQRRLVAEEIVSIPDDDERVLIATGRYIGEGFDDARLDTLFLTMPISWRGTVQQYAGRLHRLHESKREVQIYDYVDINVPVLRRMYDKRLTGYKAIGYSIKARDSSR